SDDARADLAIAVRTPAPRLGAHQPTGEVTVTSDDLVEFMVAGQRGRSVDGVVVLQSEFTGCVFAEAPLFALPVDAAGVVLSGGDGNELEVASDRCRFGHVGTGTDADLPVTIESPAVGGALLIESAGVVASHRQFDRLEPRLVVDGVGCVDGRIEPGCTVAELSGVVGAPAPDLSGSVDRTGEREAGVDGDELVTSCDRDGLGAPVGHVAVAELAGVVLAPTPGRTVHVESTGVLASGGDGGEVVFTQHRDGSRRAVDVPALSQLAVGVVAPAPGVSGFVQSAAVIGPAGDIGHLGERQGDGS